MGCATGRFGKAEDALRRMIADGMIIAPKTAYDREQLLARLRSHEGDRYFICGPGVGQEDAGPCRECGCLPDVLCDYPVGQDGVTCSAPLCGYCAHEVAPDVHYCPGHYAQWREFVEGGGLNPELANVLPFPGERRR